MLYYEHHTARHRSQKNTTGVVNCSGCFALQCEFALRWAVRDNKIMAQTSVLPPPDYTCQGGLTLLALGINISLINGVALHII